MSDTATDSPARLIRPAEGRVLAGVCAGTARQLRLEPFVVRFAFVLLTAAGGMGIVAYAALWLFSSQEEGPRRREWGQLVSYGAIAVVFALLLNTFQVGALFVLAWPLTIGAIGILILWQQADAGRRQRWVRSTAEVARQSWVRSGLGLLLVVGGMIGFLYSSGELAEAGEGLVSTAVVVGGLGLIAAPWLTVTWRELQTERTERARQEERAEMAAHLHDSVLHTLTLIQRNAADSREVVRLARSQERDLRAWLYEPQADAETTFAAAVRKIAAEVEDGHGVPVEVVCVGDCALDDKLRSLLQAAREAMVNAAKHAYAPEISVFAEVEEPDATIFVRDKGLGFDLNAVPEDRMGVKGSIIGRMERHGGTARVKTAPGEGTEVMLSMKVSGDSSS